MEIRGHKTHLSPWKKASGFPSGGGRDGSLAKRVGISFALVLALGAVNAWVSLQSLLRVTGDKDRVVRCHQEVSEIQGMLASLLGMETANRGYAITGRKGFRRDFQKYEAEVGRQWAELQAMTQEETPGGEGLSRLARLLPQKIRFMDHTLRIRDGRGREAALAFIARGDGPQLTDDIRDLLGTMRSGQEELLARRLQRSRLGISRVRTVLLLFDSTVFLCLCVLIYLMTRDLVHQEAMNRVLRLSEEKFRGLLEAAPDAMVILDEKGGIVLANEQAGKLFGWGRDEMVGKEMEALVSEKSWEGHRGQGASFFKAPRARSVTAGMDLSGLRKDGTEFPAEISLSPLLTEGGAQVIAAVRDVSERRRFLEEENRRMREASRLKSQFLANMSHELRTPMNAIIGFTELMLRGRVGPVSPEHKEYLGDILTSSRHLLQLINDILDLSKVESGRMEFKAEPVDLAGAAAEVRDVLRGLAAQKRIQVEVRVNVGASSAFLDGAKFKQVLYNYLSNAIKFTEEGGRIEVRITLEGDGFFRLEVEDNGMGIRPEDLSRLFVEFQQLDGGFSKRHAGTGLGLALVKRLVEAQGGRVGVRSEPGKGSVFSAVLPLGSPALCEGKKT